MTLAAGMAPLSTAQLMIAGAWLLLGTALVGLGLVVARLLRAPGEGIDRLSLAFWLGWSGAVFILQLWQLALPVQPGAPVLVAALGLAGFAVFGREPLRRFLARPLWSAAGVALGLVIVLWLANRAQGGPQHGDSGLYHVPTIRWLVEQPIVPGLGNLFFAFGDNQSSFLYTAMLDVGPFTHRSHHLASGLLILALFARTLAGVFRVVQRRGRVAPVDLFYALLAPAVVEIAASIYLTTPSPDVAIYGLGIVLSGELVALLTRSAEPSATPGGGWGPDGASSGRILAMAFLAAGGVTVKLSFVGLGAASLAVAAGVSIARDRPGIRAVSRVVAYGAGIALVGLVPWAIRGIVLTGYPFFPSLIGAAPVDWRMPPKDAAEVLAPYMFEIPWSAPFRDPRWFKTVLDRFGWLDREFMLPAAIAAGALPLAVVLRLLMRRRDAPPTPYVSALVLLPPIVSVLFCFIAGRLARYVGASIWIFAADAVVVGSYGARQHAGRSLRMAATLGALALSCLPLLEGRGLPRYDLRDFEQVGRPHITSTRLDSGLVVSVPDGIPCCWDAPLPCTPFPKQTLKLRREGDLRSGFVLDPTITPQAGG